MNIAEAYVGSLVQSIANENDVNTIAVRGMLEDRRSETQVRVTNLKISTQERLRQLIEDEEAKGDKANARLINSWSRMVEAYADELESSVAARR